MRSEALTGLHRAGRLAAEYPLVRGLLAGLGGDDLAHAGRLLARLDPDDVLREHPGTPVVTVAVTGHGTLAPLVSSLTAELARHGIVLRSFVGDYDGYLPELADPGSALYRADPDLALCVIDPGIVFDELPCPWRLEDVERVLEEKLRLLGELAVTFGRNARGTLVFNTLPLLGQHVAQLVDQRSRARLGVIWRSANIRLLELAEAHSSVLVVDLDPLVAEGVAVTDVRLSAYARVRLSPGLLGRYAREVGHLARSVAGRTGKCLVVDLDGTLWKGVLGDDGVEGIEVGEGHHGAAFADFQRVVKQVAAQGVMLAAVSKNDPGPVREVLRGRRGMVLREEDFTRVVANWRPKHDNLVELARDLNVGVDSLVFVDDSAFECGLVRSELPGVAVVQLDEEPASHPGRLLADSWFVVRELTAEDRARTVRYREDLVRRDFLDQAGSLAGYLAGLGVWVRMGPVVDGDVPRVAQLTQRTNQFNLMTRRLQPAEVEALRTAPGSTVLSVRAGDRFGENGLVGVVFLVREGEDLRIEDFLLSCRVFSRGIEQACLSAVLAYAASAGVRTARGSYRPTAKNGKVADFYARHGFTEAGEDGGVVWFRHDLKVVEDSPAHVDLSFEGGIA